MTLEFNTDERNSMLIAIISGDYNYDKVVKVVKMSLERCLEQNLNRVLIDMAQISGIDVEALQNFTFSPDLTSSWGKKVRLCIVYDHKFIPEIHNESKEGPDGWVLLTPNKNQSVFWLLSK